MLWVKVWYFCLSERQLVHRQNPDRYRNVRIESRRGTQVLSISNRCGLFFLFSLLCWKINYHNTCNLMSQKSLWRSPVNTCIQTTMQTYLFHSTSSSLCGYVKRMTDSGSKGLGFNFYCQSYADVTGRLYVVYSWGNVFTLRRLLS